MVQTRSYPPNTPLSLQGYLERYLVPDSVPGMPDASGGAGRDRPKHECWIEACGASQQGKDKAKRPSVRLNEDSACLIHPYRQFNLVKHALSKQSIRCTIRTALIWLIPTLVMCGVAFALGRAEEQHHRCDRDISTIEAGNESEMREVRVSALTSFPLTSPALSSGLFPHSRPAFSTALRGHILRPVR